MLEFNKQIILIISRPSQISRDAAKEWFTKQAQRLGRLDFCIWRNNLKSLAIAKAFSTLDVEEISYTLLGAIDNKRFKEELWSHTHYPTLRAFIDELIEIEYEIMKGKARPV